MDALWNIQKYSLLTKMHLLQFSLNKDFLFLASEVEYPGCMKASLTRSQNPAGRFFNALTLSRAKPGINPDQFISLGGPPLFSFFSFNKCDLRISRDATADLLHLIIFTSPDFLGAASPRESCTFSFPVKPPCNILRWFTAPLMSV